MLYVFLDDPTSDCVPVVVNVAVSSFTNPEIEPSAVNAVPSYTLEADGVVTVRVAGVIVIEPSTFVMFNLLVTSLPCAFLMIRVSQVAVTVPSATAVAVALDGAVSSV